MASALAIVEVLQGKPPLICPDKFEDRRLKQLRVTPTVDSNAFQAVHTLNDDRMLLDDEVNADVVIELRHIPFQQLAITARDRKSVV